MGVGPRTNVYNIGGDPLTQLNFFNFFFLCILFLNVIIFLKNVIFFWKM